MTLLPRKSHSLLQILKVLQNKAMRERRVRLEQAFSKRDDERQLTVRRREYVGLVSVARSLFGF